MDFDVSHAGAFLAGILSFASPCVLPLVPAYLCFLGGVSLEQLTEIGEEGRARSRRVALAALAFVLGFSTVFVVMGATASALSKILSDNMGWLSAVAGGIIVLFGLHYMGAFRIAFLNYEKRIHVERKPAGLLGAFLVGLAFAFGWTPCVGPVLASVLFVAGSKSSVAEGVGLLAAYAAGMGIPFLAAALLAGPFLGFMARARRHLWKVEIAMGALLVATGLLILTGKINEIGNWLLNAVPAFGRMG